MIQYEVDFANCVSCSFGIQAHPEGAINVQIYRLIKEWTAWDIARRAAFAFFGIFSGTEENPEFIRRKNTLHIVRGGDRVVQQGPNNFFCIYIYTNCWIPLA